MSESAEELSAEPVADDGAEPYCRWPACNEDPAVSPDGGHTWWCWTHLTDDHLVPLESGVIGACLYCKNSTDWWWVRWPEEHDLPLHPQCRRPWAMRMAESEAGRAGAPVEEAAVDAPAAPRMGGYARRAQRGSGG